MGDEFEDTSVDTGSDMSDSSESFDDSSMDAGDEPIEDRGSEGLDNSTDVGLEDSGDFSDDGSMDAGDESVDDSGAEGLGSGVDSDESFDDTEAESADNSAEGLPDNEETSSDVEEPITDNDAPTDDSDAPAEEEDAATDDAAEDLPDGDAEGTDEPADQSAETTDENVEDTPESEEPSDRAEEPIDENAEAPDVEGLPQDGENAADTDEPIDENAEANDASANDLPEDDSTDESTEATDNGAEDLPDGDAEKSDEAADQNSKSADDGAEDLPNGNKPTEDIDAAPNKDDGTDWERTSLTPEQEAQFKDMDEAGEIDIPKEDPSWQEPIHKDGHLPTEKTGTFEGERGESAFRPNNEAALNKMNEYGRDSVDYQNGNPDFSPFTQHDTPYGEMDGQVEIPHMTDNRENSTWDYGRRPAGASHNPNYDLGNFAQADNALSKKMGNMTPEQVEAYRKDNGLTWHECPDGKTMQLIPTEIHDACRHSGGVSEQKYRQAMGDIAAPMC